MPRALIKETPSYQNQYLEKNHTLLKVKINKKKYML
jgi:hypothetical protein